MKIIDFTDVGMTMMILVVRSHNHRPYAFGTSFLESRLGPSAPKVDVFSTSSLCFNLGALSCLFVYKNNCAGVETKGWG